MSAEDSISPASSIGSSVADILADLLAKGFRRTHALTCLLNEMAADPRPRALAEWAALPSLRERNAVTLYRLMLRLEQAGVVRRVNLGDRAQCFQLLLPGPAPDYLVCTSCGGLETVETPPEVRTVEVNLAEKAGWKAVRRELELFGLCPQCAQNDPPPEGNHSQSQSFPMS
ncbi:MAG: transcriptional repressor [Prosthecobacter sp.]